MLRFLATSLVAALSLGCAVLFAGCAQGGFADAGARPDARPRLDAGPTDSGVVTDSGLRPDTGVARDSGVTPTDSGLVDAGRDSGPADSGVVRDSGTGGTFCMPSPTNMAIVEVMVASQSGSGDRGEWFEVQNLGACPIDMTGLIVESPTGSGSPRTHEVTRGVLTAGGFFVFGQSGDPADHHGLPVDYVYGSGTTGVVLNNSTDSLILSFGGTEIDRVAWGSTDHRTGASRQLSRGAESGDNSSLGATSYCDSTDIYSSATGGPFLGTPGARNRACP